MNGGLIVNNTEDYLRIYFCRLNDLINLSLKVLLILSDATLIFAQLTTIDQDSIFGVKPQKK